MLNLKESEEREPWNLCISKQLKTLGANWITRKKSFVCWVSCSDHKQNQEKQITSIYILSNTSCGVCRHTNQLSTVAIKIVQCAFHSESNHTIRCVYQLTYWASQVKISYDNFSRIGFRVLRALFTTKVRRIFDVGSDLSFCIQLNTYNHYQHFATSRSHWLSINRNTFIFICLSPLILVFVCCKLQHFFLHKE